MTSTLPDKTGHGLARSSRYPIGRRARRDAAVRKGAVSALGLSLLLVTHWWVVDGGVKGLGGWVSSLSGAPERSGRLAPAARAVLLMARVPLLELTFGQDRLAHVHRRIG